MNTIPQVEQWILGAAAQFEDPAEPVCQLFFRWQDERSQPAAPEDLVCSFDGDELVLQIGSAFPPLPMHIVAGEPRIGLEGAVEAFGVEFVTAGVWALTPSLNVPGMLHGFVVLYDVPQPAPWVRRILLPGDASFS